ncbi:hypothetical protein CTAYLR_002512 [Chrysophaeum taylorii]|uniref:Uncharacterized protein n=1 Tax=Chrysophaeum taylorii TaxID=2483200 RepID=A0AAD7UGX3_9STRA|nr:hypothetical protein CTAYLR_002512 [Chrysophaeum taylorii]
MPRDEELAAAGREWVEGVVCRKDEAVEVMKAWGDLEAEFELDALPSGAEEVVEEEPQQFAAVDIDGEEPQEEALQHGAEEEEEEEEEEGSQAAAMEIDNLRSPKSSGKAAAAAAGFEFSRRSPKQRGPTKRLDLRTLATSLAQSRVTTESVRGRDVTVLLGRTGVGKTTFIHARAGLGQVVDGRFQVEAMDGFCMSDGLDSCTKYLTAHFGDQEILVDTSGFADSKGAGADVAMGAAVRELATAVASIKFVVLVSCATITTAGDRGKGAKDIASLVAKFLGGDFRLYCDSFLFLFTHVEALIGRHVDAMVDVDDADRLQESRLRKARHAVKKDLENALESDLDDDARDVFEFMLHYFETRRCDVFDPMLVDAKKLDIGSLEPITNPGAVVKCGMTTTAGLSIETSLQETVRRCTAAVDDVVTCDAPDADAKFSALLEDVRAVSVLKDHLEEADHAARALEELKGAISDARCRIGDDVDTFIRRGTDAADNYDDNDDDFTPDDARRAMRFAYHLRSLDELLGQHVVSEPRALVASRVDGLSGALHLSLSRDVKNMRVVARSLARLHAWAVALDDDGALAAAKAAVASVIGAAVTETKRSLRDGVLQLTVLASACASFPLLKRCGLDDNHHHLREVDIVAARDRVKTRVLVEIRELASAVDCAVEQGILHGRGADNVTASFNEIAGIQAILSDDERNEEGVLARAVEAARRGVVSSTSARVQHRCRLLVAAVRGGFAAHLRVCYGAVVAVVRAVPDQFRAEARLLTVLTNTSQSLRASASDQIVALDALSANLEAAGLGDVKLHAAGLANLASLAWLDDDDLEGGRRLAEGTEEELVVVGREVRRLAERYSSFAQGVVVKAVALADEAIRGLDTKKAYALRAAALELDRVDFLMPALVDVCRARMCALVGEWREQGRRHLPETVADVEPRELDRWIGAALALRGISEATDKALDVATRRVEAQIVAYGDEALKMLRGGSATSSDAIIRRVLDAAKAWRDCPAIAGMLPPYDSLVGIVEDRLAQEQDSIEAAIRDEVASLDDAKARVQGLRDMAPDLDGHLRNKINAWCARLDLIVDKKEGDIELAFEAQLNANDFGGIRIVLDRLLDAGDSSSTLRYNSYVKVVRARVANLLETAREAAVAPRVVVVNVVVDDVAALEDASRCLDDLSVWSPPLAEDIRGLKTSFANSVADDVAELRAALDRFDILRVRQGLGLALARSKAFERWIPGTCFAALEKIKVDASRALDALSREAAAFLTPMRKDGRHKTSFASSTQRLRMMLDGFQGAKHGAADESRYDERDVARRYDAVTKELAEELTKIHEDLMAEARSHRYAWPLQVLVYLQLQLHTNLLERHVPVAFDAAESLEEVRTMQRERATFLKNNLLRREEIAIVAAELEERHAALSAPSGWFSFLQPKTSRQRVVEEDYESLSELVTAHVGEFMGQLYRNIENRDFDGIRDRFATFADVEAKLHRCVDRAAAKRLKHACLAAIENFGERVVATIRNNDVGAFELVFKTFRDLAVPARASVVAVATTAPQSTTTTTTSDTFLVKIESSCGDLRRKIHEELAAWIEKLAASFVDAVRAMDFAPTARDAGDRLVQLGFFSISTFALYFDDLKCHRADDASLAKVVDVIARIFGKGKISKLGRHFALLELAATATVRDVERSYRQKSRQWYPDKHPSTERERVTAVFHKLSAAKEELGLEANMKFVAEYSYAFLNALVGVRDQVQRDVQSDLKRAAYEEVARKIERLKWLPALASLLPRDSRNVVDGVWAHATTAVAQHVHQEFGVRVDNLWTKQHLHLLHRTLARLEDAERHLGKYKEIFRESRTARLLEQFQEKMAFSADRIKQRLAGSESQALRALNAFARDLVDLGHVMYNVRLCKSFARLKIVEILDECQTKEWGYAFIFKLGSLLETGDVFAAEDDASQRVARVIVCEFPHFSDIITMIFNEEVVRADVVDSINEIEVETLSSSNSSAPPPPRTKLETRTRNTLREAFENYEREYERCFKTYVCGDDDADPDALVAEVLGRVRDIGPVSAASWTIALRTEIPLLLGGCFAYFTILKSGQSFKRLDAAGEKNLSRILLKPHSIQVLTILRLLGCCDDDGAPLASQLVEIRTGEGKSIILGGCTIIAAILGFRVRCVCYSDFLSSRDHDFFRDLFVAFGVSARITYSKITTMSEDTIAEKGDIRSLTCDLMRGTLRGASGPLITRRAPPIASSSSSSSSSLSRREVEGAIVHRTMPAKGALPLYNENLMLVDEVDVFFGSDFYAETYNQVAQVADASVRALLELIWNHKHLKALPLWKYVKGCEAYKQVQTKFSSFSDIVETEVRNACSDVACFADPPYAFNETTQSIGYTVMDRVDYDVTYGYRTSFAYLNERHRLKNADEVLSSVLCLKVSCGQFAYANVSPTCVLGVSGTLKALEPKERSIISQFGITSCSYVPSVYGPNNFEFDKAGAGIKIEASEARFHQEIASDVKAKVDDDRPVIVFFEDDARLRAFTETSHWKRMPTKTKEILATRATKDERNFVIKKATNPKQVTLSTAVFGRGTDFFCKDNKKTKPRDRGGTHVIQTFLSEQRSEEVQIQGRTARQGRHGSYALILLAQHLETKYGITQTDLERVERPDRYAFLDRRRAEYYAEQIEELQKTADEAKGRDALSRKYFESLLNGDAELAKTHLRSLYEAVKPPKVPGTCRMMCLSDATGSMSHVWEETKNKISEMLRRIREVGGDDVRLQIEWVAYRDYSDAALLERSGWTSEATELLDFVNNIRCAGGGDEEEAVEAALQLVNVEHEINSEVTRVLLIADAPPHGETKGSKLEGHDHVLETDYRTEAAMLAENGIPVYTFRLNDKPNLVRAFDEIAETTGGRADLLETTKLLDAICTTALDDIGGSDLVAEYRRRYN